MQRESGHAEGEWPCRFKLSFVLFNDSVNRSDHTGPGDEFTRRNMSQCQFAHHKSHTAWPGIEAWPPR